MDAGAYRTDRHPHIVIVAGVRRISGAVEPGAKNGRLMSNRPHQLTPTPIPAAAPSGVGRANSNALYKVTQEPQAVSPPANRDN
jgi:hypothetical protein